MVVFSKSLRPVSALTVAALVVLGILPGTSRPAAAAAAFFDVSSHWSRVAVEKMTLKGVLSGFEDGTYRPDQAITQIEMAVGLVRVLGLDSTARGTPESAFAGTPYASLPGWARGYAAVAVARGLIDEDDVRNGLLPGPAVRHEVAAMAVRALNLTQEAETRGGMLPDFRDALEIPYDARGFVAVAAERKLVQGDASGFFRPNAGITRAEMAVLLDRVDRRISNAIDQREVLGEVTSVEAATSSASRFAGKISLTRVGGTSSTVEIPTVAAVYRGGREATLSEIRPFDEVVILQNPAGDVVFVAADPPPYETYRGKVVRALAATADADATLRLEVDGQERSFAVASTAVVRRDGATARVIDLLPGDDARVQVDAGKIIRIEAATVTRRVSGTLTSVTLSATPSFVITTDDGTQETFAVSDRTVIRRGDTTIGLTDLGLGHYLAVSASNNLATWIDVETRNAFQELSGVIVSIDADARRLVIAVTSRPVAADADPTRSVRVLGNAIVVRNAEVTTFGALRVGDRVMLAGWSRLNLFDANTVVVTYTR